jgi:predicted dehydrogenase
MAGTCAIHSVDGRIEHLDDVPAEGRYPNEATSRHLVDLVLSDDPALANASSGEIGARTVELLEAAYRSAAERRVVRIDEL